MENKDFETWLHNNPDVVIEVIMDLGVKNIIKLLSDTKKLGEHIYNKLHEVYQEEKETYEIDYFKEDLEADLRERLDNIKHDEEQYLLMRG